MNIDYISLQVLSFVGAVLLVACTVSISSFGSVKVCVFYELKSRGVASSTQIRTCLREKLVRFF